MRVLSIVIACILAGAVTNPLAAEERAWFLTGNSLTQVSVTDGGREWTGTWQMPLPPHGPSQPLVVAGGRYIVWAASNTWTSAFVRLDTRLRDVAILPAVSPAGAVNLAIDRRTGYVAALDFNALYVFDVAALRLVSTIPAPTDASVLERSLAVAGGRAYIGTRTIAGAGLRVVDLDTGALVAEIPDLWFARASRDETRVFLQRRYEATIDGAPYMVVEMQAWDSCTLSCRATVTYTISTFLHDVGGYAVSETIGGPLGPIEVRAHDPDTLAVLLDAVLPAEHQINTLFELQEASPVAPIVLRTQSCDAYTRLCSRLLRVFDRATLTPRARLWNAPFDTPRSALVMLAPPVAPEGLRAEVTGSSVRIDWNSAPDVGGYELSAGFAPGVFDIGTIRTGAAPFVRIDGVPSGTYYVRVRALNELGSAASTELRIVVP